MRIFIVVLFITLSASVSSYSTEVDNKPLQQTIKKIREFSDESEKLLDAINTNKNRISWYHNMAGFFIVVLPYSASWLIDTYFPQGYAIKEALHYSVTPLTQLTGILMFRHNFAKASKKLEKADACLQDCYDFFYDLEEVIQNLSKISEKSSENLAEKAAETYLNNLYEETTPVGEFLLSVLHLLQDKKIIKIVPTKDAALLRDIFSATIETVESLSTKKIKKNKTILHFNGIPLSTYNFLDLNALKELVVKHFKVTYSSSKI